MNEPVCKRCDIEMEAGFFSAPNTPGAIFWQQKRDEQRRVEMAQLSRKELKEKLKEAKRTEDFSAFDLVSFSVTAYRCSSCGLVELFAREE